MAPIGLRLRFVAAGVLLVATTLATTVYSARAFLQLSQVVDATIRDSERTTSGAADLMAALEREDDALLLTASEPTRGRRDLAASRARVERALRTFEDLLAAVPDAKSKSSEVRGDVAAYHAAGDVLLQSRHAEVGRALYHTTVNPLLRRAVAAVERIREGQFRSTEAAASWARDQARRSRQVLLAISLGALALTIGVSLHLARRVLFPIRDLTAAVEAMRQGDFDRRLALAESDEIGRLTEGFNRMAADLALFRRARIGEVLRAKETMEATLAALPDAVVVVERTGEVSSANTRARELMDEVSFTRPVAFESLPLPEITKEAVGAVLRGRASGRSTVDFSTAIRKEVGGKERRWMPRIVPVDPGSRGSRGAVLVLSDVTEPYRLDEMRMELVAVASHELRTPLTTLRMTLLMLQERGDRLQDQDRALVNTALVGVQQLSTTIAGFLDLTQIEAGQLRLARETIEAERLLGDARRGIETTCEENGIRLATQVTPDAPKTIAGDPTRLAAVLSNVLANAAKYTPRGGRIDVSASRYRHDGVEALRLDIVDTGPGVDPEFRERVFEKFFRVEHQRPGAPAGVRGSGIGLYVCREILRAHGGSIHCVAGPEQRGSCFVIVLPIGDREGMLEQGWGALQPVDVDGAT